MYGLKVTLLGMGTVFIALFILMNLISIMSNFLVPKPKIKTESLMETAPVQSQVNTVQETENDDADELSAVIAAAVAACGQQVIIKTITRLNGTSGAAWSTMGRSQVMNQHQL